MLYEQLRAQGNAWNEVIVPIDDIPKEFQLVFEATGSRTISDIAIDDVSLYNDDTCHHSDVSEVTTEVATESDGIYQMQSCTNRCNETQSARLAGTTIVIMNRLIEVCDCHMDCLDLETCCYDYNSICLGMEKMHHFVWFND